MASESSEILYLEGLNVKKIPEGIVSEEPGCGEGKKPERKRKNLTQLGIEEGQAYSWKLKNESF